MLRVRAGGADRLLAGWMALVAVLLLTPADLIPAWPGLEGIDAPAGLDKAGHFLLFLVLAALAVVAARPRTRHPLLIAAVSAFLYGALLEGLQGLSGLRLPELGDLLANGIGSLAGAWMPGRWRRP